MLSQGMRKDNSMSDVILITKEYNNIFYQKKRLKLKCYLFSNSFIPIKII